MSSQSVWRVCQRLDHGTLHTCHWSAPVWLCSRYFNCPRTGTGDALLAKGTTRAWENGQGFNACLLRNLRQSSSFYCILLRNLASYMTAQLPGEVADFILVSTAAEGQTGLAHIMVVLHQSRCAAGHVMWPCRFSGPHKRPSHLLQHPEHVDACSIWEVWDDDNHDSKIQDAANEGAKWLSKRILWNSTQIKPRRRPSHLPKSTQFPSHRQVERHFRPYPQSFERQCHVRWWVQNYLGSS